MAEFSLIIPVYNAEKTIARCVDSVLDGCGVDLEVILVEDCAKDGSWAECQRLAEKYACVTALHNEQNRGVSHTRNRGLEAASGRYVLFCDSDDWVAPGYAAAFAAAAKAFDPDFVVCGYTNHDEKQNRRTDVYGWTDFEGVRRVPLQPELEKLHAANLLQQLWNKMLRLDIIRQHGIRFDESISIGEDTRFIYAYLAAAGTESVVEINRPLYHYMRDQDGSLMFRIGYESVEEPLKNKTMLYRLMGLPEEEIRQRIAGERTDQIRLYAYLIMHNMGMPMKERRRLIYGLDRGSGKRLFRENLILLWKEKIASWVRRSR